MLGKTILTMSIRQSVRRRTAIQMNSRRMPKVFQRKVLPEATKSDISLNIAVIEEAHQYLERLLLSSLPIRTRPVHAGNHGKIGH